jgi:hypothetical protein
MALFKGKNLTKVIKTFAIYKRFFSPSPLATKNAQNHLFFLILQFTW